MKELFYDQLMSLREQTITIYILGFNDANCSKISGVLISVKEDYITLLIQPGGEAIVPIVTNAPINFNKCLVQPSVAKLNVPGLLADIPICKIATVIHYAI